MIHTIQQAQYIGSAHRWASLEATRSDRVVRPSSLACDFGPTNRPLLMGNMTLVVISLTYPEVERDVKGNIACVEKGQSRRSRRGLGSSPHQGERAGGE